MSESHETPAGKPPVKGWIKTALDFGPLLIFFVIYGRIKDQTFLIGGEEYSGFVLATAGFVPLLLLSTAILWRLTGKLAAMQIITLVLVVVFGGLTIWLNDERFFKMKPTLIYLLFAGILGFGLLRGRSYLSVAMGEFMPLKHEGWMKLTRRFTVFFLALAVANEVIWRMASTDLWVKFKVFGFTGLTLVFIMTQAPLLAAYAAEDAE